MKMKSIITALITASAFSMGAVAVAGVGTSQAEITAVKYVKKPSQKSLASIKLKKSIQDAYFAKNAHEGTELYIVRLVDKPVTTYRGGVAGFKATNLSSKSSNGAKFDAKSVESKQYLGYLDSKQTSFINKASTVISAPVPNLRSLKYAINGLITELTFAQAKSLAVMDEVAFVERNQLIELQTDTGPEFIGAGEVWDGTATGTEYLGEGVVIGIIDTGINTDHRSYAATGDDGYTVINPRGDGNYLGDCVTDATLCNSKLIGVTSFPVVLNFYRSDPIFAGIDRPLNGEDYNGHGSHTSSTAGGNVLLNVPLTQNDPTAGATDDGIERSLIFPRMSGVAPHANIISYQICIPGDDGDTYSGCFSAGGIGAIDQAIADEVDVINYSIGGTTNFDPWQSSTELGFLSARAAGIYVATSAGNAGPGPATSTKASPWYSAVAATTHGRIAGTGMTFDGVNYASTTGTGPALPASITAPLVYAGTVDATNFEGCNAFPAGSFTGSAALISRGACGFLAKIDNATAAGATFVVVHNNRDGDATLVMGAAETTTIPAVMISENNGAIFVAALTATPGLSGTLSNTIFVSTTGVSDTVASFSSRGPNDFGGIIVPTMAAPGVGVYAAYADDVPYKDINGPDPSDFAILSGTSMASPHVAGAAALLTQAQPTWDPDQIRSALMMTATTAVLKEDATTDADPFDIGAGRVQVNLAVNAGLVMSETEANYLAADPSLGGTSSTLNIPSLADYACNDCMWSRTFTAVTTDTYALSSNDALLTVSPTSVDATAGEDFVVTFTYDTSGLATFDEAFAQIDIEPALVGSPDLHMPVYVRVNKGLVPGKIDIKAGRNTGSYKVNGFVAPRSANLDITFVGILDANATGKTTVVPFAMEGDSDNSAVFDDVEDGTVIQQFDVGGGIKEINLSITESTSQDNDLYVQVSLGNGVWSDVANVTTGAADEVLSISSPAEGLYRAIVQNWLASSPGATDTGVLTIDVVPITDPIAGVTIQAPTSTNGISQLDVRLFWDLDHIFPFGVGSKFNGTIFYTNGEGFEGEIPFTIERVGDDVTISSTTVGPVTRGDVIDYSINVPLNLYPEIMEYGIDVNLPPGTTIVDGSVNVSGGNVTVKDPNAVGLSVIEPFSMAKDSNNGDAFDDLTDGVFVYEFEVPTATLSMTISITDSTSTDNDLFIQRLVGGNWTTVDSQTNATANESSTISSPIEGSWRAVVQNWGGSSAAEDTGNLHVNLTPASGSGLIWSGTSAVSLNTYNVVSSASDAACAAATTWNGYLALEGFNIGTIDFEGDTISTTIFGGVNFNLFGVDHDGITITDDGFGIVSGTPGPTPWANTAIPNSVEPNDMIAMLWKDLQVFKDVGDTRGIRLANAGGGWLVADFDEIGAWNDDTQRYNFNLWVQTAPGPDDFEYVVSYSATQVGDLTDAVAGIENADGSSGVDVTSLIEPGVDICYDAVQTGDQFTINFSVLTSAETVGNPVAPVVTVSSDLIGSDDFRAQSDGVYMVNTAPIADAGADQSVDRGNSGVQVTLSGLGSINLDLDVLDVTWIKVGGDASAVVTAPNSLEAGFDVQNVPNGVYTFKLTISDEDFSSSDSVTITVTGAKSTSSAIVSGTNGSSGSGAMSYLLALLGIAFFRRRKFSR